MLESWKDARRTEITTATFSLTRSQLGEANIPLHGQTIVAGPEVKVSSSRVCCLPDLNILEPRLQEACKVFLVMEFVLVLMEVGTASSGSMIV